MSSNQELQRVNEWSKLRGFSNLLSIENHTWWRTRRWWINALLWLIMLGGLTVFILFIPRESVAQSTEAGKTQAGEELAATLQLGIGVFFNFGVLAVATGTIILSQDLIVGEKQSGLTELLISKPVVRRSYILAKLVANAIPIVFFLVGLPSSFVYIMLSLRMGTFFPLLPFLLSVGLMALHTLYYLTLTLMLGTFFNTRGIIMGISLGFALVGSIIGTFIMPLLFITPWILSKVTALVAGSQPVPQGLFWGPVISTALFSIIFILTALWKFAKTDF